MKKIIIALMCAAAFCISALGLSACGNKTNGSITVYAPDGAPALALARLMSGETDFVERVSYKIVSSEEISSSITYNDESKNADMCILPVNTASKLVGNGQSYKMLGTVTHGNLYIVAGKDKPTVTADNAAETLDGARIGVVNLAGFPGAATRLVLKKHGILNGVTLEGVAATQVTGTEAQYDYFVIPEPAASTRLNNPNLNLKLAGSLQSLYGENGYPQAVLVAKNSLIEKNSAFISKFMEAMSDSADWLLDESVTAEAILNAVKAHYADPENTKPAFTAEKLTKTVIGNCAIRFEPAAQSKQRVKAFLSELADVNDTAATAVSDEFFYNA